MNEILERLKELEAKVQRQEKRIVQLEAAVGVKFITSSPEAV